MNDDDPSPFLVQIPAEKAALPVANIYCIGRNYAEHAKELGNAVPKEEPVVFLKSTGALRFLATPGTVAFADEAFHHEAEIVLLIGRWLGLGEAGDWSRVRAVGLGLDLTRRGVQTQLKSKGLPWTTAKSFAGSALVTDFVPRQSFSDLDDIEFSLSVDGVTRQHGHSRDMIFKVPALLTYLASLQPLMPGDLVYTGTPAGVGELRRGATLALGLPQLGVEFTGVL